MAESVRLWCYVLAQDVGIAPCVDDGMLTLCTCKPKIRKSARVGDWVLAKLPEPLGIGRVTWIGEVAEVIDMGAYAERYPFRVDACYVRTADGRSVHRAGSYHSDDGKRDNELLRMNCLIFRSFWNFGVRAQAIATNLVFLCDVRRNHRKWDLEPPRVRELLDWLSQWPPGLHGEPREAEEGARWRAQMPFLQGSGSAAAGGLGARVGAVPLPGGCGSGGGRPATGRATRRRGC